MLNRNVLFYLALSAFFSLATGAFGQTRSALDDFLAPPDSAKPGVYWFFMDGNLSKSGMFADLEALKTAGMNRAIIMEADLGGPKGDVPYMSAKWIDCWRDATQKARELGVELTSSVGPGWCGAGGPWIDPDHSMQHLCASFTQIEGGRDVEIQLDVPDPRDPYFGKGSLGPCENDWRQFYRDVAVLAYPTPKSDRKLPDWEEKALFYRPPYSSTPGVKPYLPTCADSLDATESLADAIIPYASIVDVSDKMNAEGLFRWNAPSGSWTIMRLVRRVTGQTTRPAPLAALGLECDKFEPTGIERHFENFNAKLYDVAQFNALHHDSWEMSSQNWSKNFRRLFIEKRGYDPLLRTPAMFGAPVESVEQTERFLWDLRRTAQELVYENNVERMKRLGAERGLLFSTEAYDLNPAGDLYLFRAADIPMCEFWAKGYGFETTFSVVEASSSAHTTGRTIVGAESFTTANDRWRQHPGLMKRQADWALCLGVNRFYIHRMCAQPNDDAPGFSLGPHGTHFDRTQTWFPLVGDFNAFLSRAQALLQRGKPTADALYLDREGAPQVFVAPSSAFQQGEFQDKREYGFDGCCPQVLIETARAENGKIVFPGGSAYSVLILPNSTEMTLELARKIKELADAGVQIIGRAPVRTPTLVDYPNADRELKEIVQRIDALNQDNDEYPDSVYKKNWRQDLVDAKWIWSQADNNAPANQRKVFTKTFELPDALSDADLQNARLVATADNVYSITINGVTIGSGNNFHSPDVHFLQAGTLKRGKNVVRLEVLNEGSAPNPAGAIACLRVNESIRIVTDGSWLNEDSTNAVELGAFDMSPWNMRINRELDPDATYPTWEVVQKKLRQMGIEPEFETEGDLRWIRRVDGEVDIFYVGNRLSEEQNVECVFRVSNKRAQIWDPVSGRRYAVDVAREENGRVVIPMRFEGSQSFFVIFQPTFDDEEELPLASDLFAPRVSVPVVDLSRDWTVSFDQNASTNRNFKEGEPKTMRFDALDDWSKSADPYLRYYSGIGVYEKTFDLDAPTIADAQYAFEFDAIEAMARVELNGKDLGTIWLNPPRIDAPVELLREKGNELKITVANLWCNRLIGDASRPVQDRFTRSSNPMWGPGDEQLQPSGIIGKCALVIRAKESNEKIQR